MINAIYNSTSQYIHHDNTKLDSTCDVFDSIHLILGCYMPSALKLRWKQLNDAKNPQLAEVSNY